MADTTCPPGFQIALALDSLSIIAVHGWSEFYRCTCLHIRFVRCAAQARDAVHKSISTRRYSVFTRMQRYIYILRIYPMY